MTPGLGGNLLHPGARGAAAEKDRVGGVEDALLGVSVRVGRRAAALGGWLHLLTTRLNQAIMPSENGSRQAAASTSLAGAGL